MNLEERADELEKKLDFIGGPKGAFREVGMNQLITLLYLGLTADNKVLDFGCGALRGGYWFINFLHPDCYFGIEGRKEMVKAGKDILFDDKTLKYKNPRFDFNTDFNFGVFGETFDYVIARSVWSHAPRSAISKSLDAFKENSHQESHMAASIFLGKPNIEGYNGGEYKGHNEEKEITDAVIHNPNWIAQISKNKGLKARIIADEFLNLRNQTWVTITHA